MRIPAFLLAAAAIGSLLAACHGESSNGGGPAGLYCQAKIAGQTVCYGYTNLEGDEADAVKEACTQALGGTMSDECPSGQIGCCTVPTAGYETTECYYVGAASSYQEGCSAEGGKWSGGGGSSPSGGPVSPGSGVDSGSPYTPPTGGQDSGVTPVGPSGCPAGETKCPNGCIDLQSDPNNCGSCEYACPVGDGGGGDDGGASLASMPTCNAGVCGLGCSDATLTACTGSGGPTYCDDLQSSEYSCGSCNNSCSSTVTSACLASTCESGQCSPGTPDPTKNGQSCDDSGGSICGNGQCLMELASCTLNTGEWLIGHNGDTSMSSYPCVCNGNALATDAGSAMYTIATCTVCLTLSSTSMLCLQ